LPPVDVQSPRLVCNANHISRLAFSHPHVDSQLEVLADHVRFSEYLRYALSWADVAEFVPWILGLALFSFSSLRPSLKVVVAVLSVPYSMLAFAAAEILVGCALGNCS
jgi:hypothetical protein